MKITEFNDQIRIGDTVMILDGHTPKAGAASIWKYIFNGFAENCNLCPGCPGYVKLIREDGKEFPDCYRSHAKGNIRLKIMTQKFLPDNLFEL